VQQHLNCDLQESGAEEVVGEERVSGVDEAGDRFEDAGEDDAGVLDEEVVELGDILEGLDEGSELLWGKEREEEVEREGQRERRGRRRRRGERGRGREGEREREREQ
jgi:hypothetical protein